MSDDKINEYAGAITIEDMERENPNNELKRTDFEIDVRGEDIDDIQQKLRDIKDSISTSSSFETELGMVRGLQNILDKIKSGILSLADIENWLKQVDEIQNDVDRIQKFERMSKKYNKDLDDISERTDDLLNKLRELDFGLTDEEKNKLVQDVERLRDDLEDKKKRFLPFIEDLQKDLEQKKDQEIDILGVIGKIQKILGIEPEKEKEEPKREPEKESEKEKEEPTRESEKESEKEKEEPTKEQKKPAEKVEKSVEMLKEVENILSMGLLELLDDWGKTPEAQNIAASLHIKNYTNNFSESVKSNNNIKIDNSRKRMREVDEKTASLERENNIKKPTLNNLKQMDKANKKDKSKDEMGAMRK